MHKPRLFVGSSKEAITIARAVQFQLQEDAAVTIWNEDTGLLGANTLNWLVHGVANYDFAAMVFTPDDRLISRGGEGATVRDNILFELGLFMARLGADRTFVVYDADPDAQVKIPSDLQAIGFATFSGKQAASPQSTTQADKYDFRNAVSALGSSCSLIRDSIRRLGSIAGMQEVRITVDQVEKKQNLQQSEIKAIQIAIKGILTKHERGHLEGLKRNEYMIPYEPDLYQYLHKLDGLNFIQPKPGFGLIDIINRHRSDEHLSPDQRPPFNLKDYVYITDEGENYLNLLEKTKDEMP